MHCLPSHHVPGDIPVNLELGEKKRKRRRTLYVLSSESCGVYGALAWDFYVEF